MYNQKAKEATMRYMADKRDQIKLNFAKGLKDRYKAFAEFRGTSFTAMIQELIEREIAATPDYDENAYLKEYLERKAQAEKSKSENDN